MSENQTPTPVLKTFAKKLANCVQNVPLYRLLDYFDNGMYGYSVEEGFDEIITNDYVFADDVATCITHIKKIFKEPHIFLKKENVIQNVSVANKMDNETLLENYKDTRFWTVKDVDNPQPEMVHAFVNEDNLAIYENRFISALIDELLDRVTKKINYLKTQIGTVNKLISDQLDELGFEAKNYVELVESNDRPPVVMSVKKPFTKVFYQLIKNKKDLINLKHREFYIACAKAGKFNINEVHLTNILIHDFEYNYCYTFFTKYVRKDYMVTTEAEAYYDFVLINLIKAITELGFKYDDETASMFVSSKANIKFEPIEFTSEMLRLTLSQNKEEDIVMTFTCVSDGSTASYYIKTLHSTEVEKGFNINEYADSLKHKDVDGKYLFGNVISNIKGIRDNYAYVNPEKSTVLKRLMVFIKSFMIIVEGSGFVHARVCPVCGSDFISPEDVDYSCVICESIYHIFGYAGREYIWIKQLPKVTKKEEEMVFDEMKVEPLPETEIQKITFDDAGADNAVYAQSEVASAAEDDDEEDMEIKEGNLFERVMRFKIYQDEQQVAKEEVAQPEQETEVVEIEVIEEVQEQPIEEVQEEVQEQPVEEVQEEVQEQPIEEVQEEPVEEPSQEEEIAENVEVQPISIEINTVTEEPVMRINRSFMGKLMQLDDKQKRIYADIKNYLLSFKRVNSRVSWTFDSFNLGRDQIAKLAIRGKTLVLFLALDPKEYIDTKYYAQDKSDLKKFAETPAMFKVKSDRGYKFALELIDILMKDQEKNANFIPGDYIQPYNDDEALLELGLAKYVESKF